MDKSNIKQELEPSTQQQIRPIPFIVSSNFLPMIPNDEPSLLHPYYMSPLIAPVHFLEQNMLINEDSGIENKLLNDVFFSPAAMLSPPPSSSELLPKVDDDVNSFTEFFGSFERTSSICSSSTISEEDEDYNTVDNHALFLCDLDFETEQESNTSSSVRMKRSINESMNTATTTIAPQVISKRRKMDILSNDNTSRKQTNCDKEYQCNENSNAAIDRNQKRNDTHTPTLYETLTMQNVDWCRYCGTTEGINWRPGPWGKRTLCNKHGCDYKGYGFACKLPRLDLTEYLKEPISKRIRPVLQLYCSICQKKESSHDNLLIFCDGCPKAFHQECKELDKQPNTPWYCTDTCCDNLKRKRVVVELPRKRLPLMRTPKSALLQEAASS
ncbi:hypothetical protein G6F35_010082 [Rhizopus arrhizus]|nr:hypothetical protein G6F35_010082 [Rhizopus arrhizus]